MDYFTADPLLGLTDGGGEEMLSLEVLELGATLG